jgi:hypothetical protein
MSLRATTTCFLVPTRRTGWDHSASTIMRSGRKASKRGWTHRRQTSLTHAYKTLFLDTTSASIPAVITLRSSLSIYVFFAYNIFSSLLVLLTAHGMLLSESPRIRILHRDSSKCKEESERQRLIFCRLFYDTRISGYTALSGKWMLNNEIERYGNKESWPN